MGAALENRTVLILAQAISILGLLLNCLSFQQKKKKMLILFQFFGAPLGFLLHAIGTVRGLVFALTQPGKRGNLFRIGIFLALFLASYPLAFTLFGVDPTARNLIVEALPVVAMCLATVSFGLPTAAGVRRITLFASPLWMTYNILNRSAGGILSELIGFCSVIIGIIRYDRREKEQK